MRQSNEQRTRVGVMHVNIRHRRIHSCPGSRGHAINFLPQFRWENIMRRWFTGARRERAIRLIEHEYAIENARPNR